MSMPTPQTDFDGWDFFNPFYGVRPESICPGYGSFGGEDLKAVREEEGLPELEKEEEREVQKSISNVMEDNNGNNVKVMDEKGLNVIDKPVRGKELLDALKDIEDHFIRAYDSGKEVSRMLEANKMHMQSGLDEIKGEFLSMIVYFYLFYFAASLSVYLRDVLHQSLLPTLTLHFLSEMFLTRTCLVCVLMKLVATLTY